MLDADRPIETSAQDRLGRSVFAKYLARCILDHKSPENLVIGLYGGPGSGKTSVLNMVREELENISNNSADAEKPIVVNFSPWNYTQAKLILGLFRRLSSAIRAASFFENSGQISYLLELYAAFFSEEPVPEKFLPRYHFFTYLLNYKIIKQKAYAWRAGRELVQVKHRLNALLRNQQHKIIIMIDNFSRTRFVEVFQMIKSILDCDNFVYVLSMDKNNAIREIKKVLGGGGEGFLEKIVQLPFEISPISQQNLDDLFVGKLKNLLSQVPKEAWDKEYWADVYNSSLKYFFVTCRDISRYINTLNFHYPRVKEVVNPVDFFAIKALAIFAPDIFQSVRNNKDLFTDLFENVYQLDKAKLAEDKLRCDEILQQTKKIPKEIILQLLTRLFPRLRLIYLPNVPFYHSEELARTQHRICSPDVFEVYFRLSIPTGYISNSEMKAILSVTADEAGFSMILASLNQDERIIKFLDLLDNLDVNKIPLKNIGNVITALLDNADLFPEGTTDALNFSTPLRIHRIIHQLLQRIETQNERFEIFRHAIKKINKSLYILVFELEMQKAEHVEKQDMPMQYHDFTVDQLEFLQKLVISKIIYWADLQRLGEHPKLLPILYFWKNQGDEQECKRFVAKMVQEDNGLINFLLVALHDPIQKAITKLARNASWDSALQNIEDFVSLELITPHAKMIFEDLSFEKLREREQLAILIFLSLVNAETVKVIPKTN